MSAINLDLPPEILKKAVRLRNSVRMIFLALCNCKSPSSATAIAKVVGKSRAYTDMRLNQLVGMGLAKETSKGKEKFFELNTE